MTSAAATHPTTDLDPRRWRALTALLIPAFMVLLGTSITSNALNTIQRGLGATYAQVQFVLAAYALCYGVLLVTGGRLGDLYGRRRVFLWGLAGFTLASLLSGLASTPNLLIAAQALTGVMAALLFPQVGSLIQVLFPPAERPRAFGLLGATIGLGTVAGPLLGGLLIGADWLGWSWRWVYLLNVPLGLLALPVIARLLHESRAEHARTLDWPGVGLVTLGLGLVIYPIVQGRVLGWPLWTFALMLAGLVVLALFVRYQGALARRDGSPLLEPSLFRERAFPVGLLATAVFYSGVFSLFIAFAIFLQAGLGFTPLHSALTVIPFQATSLVTALLSAPLTARLGRHVLSLGTALLALGLLGVIVTLDLAGTTLRGPELLPAFVVCGAGFGFVTAPLLNAVLAGIPPRFAGAASGVLSTSQQVGGAIGVALVGVILFGQVSGGADRAGARVLPGLGASLERAGLPAPAVRAVQTGFTTCFHDRSVAQDPNRVPASCRQRGNLPAPVQAKVASATGQAASAARADNFRSATLVTLRYHLVIYLLTFLLVLLLPNARRLTPARNPAR